MILGKWVSLAAAELGWTFHATIEHTVTEIEAVIDSHRMVKAADELTRLQTMTVAVAVAMDGRNKAAHQKWAKRLADLAEGRIKA